MWVECSDFEGLFQGQECAVDAVWNRCDFQNVLSSCSLLYIDENGEAIQEECNLDDYSPEMWAEARKDAGWEKSDYRDWFNYWERRYGFIDTEDYCQDVDMHVMCNEFEFFQGADCHIDAKYNKCSNDILLSCNEKGTIEGEAYKKECNIDDYSPEMWAQVRYDPGWENPAYSDWWAFWDRMYGFNKADRHGMDHRDHHDDDHHDDDHHDDDHHDDDHFEKPEDCDEWCEWEYSDWNNWDNEWDEETKAQYW